MLKSLVGAFIGSRIDRQRDGRGGLAGAAIGIAATRLATRSIPGALLIGGGAIAAKMISKRIEARRTHRRPQPPAGPVDPLS